MLTKCTAKCPEADGSFPQVSGLKYTIHAGSHTVTDVMVQDEGAETYQPLDPNGKYTVATIDYALSGGFYRTLQNCKLVSLTEVLSRDALSEHLVVNLNGVMPDKYKDVEGRITILND
jgi:2',3'-cyclic-nucleotide 2'-phosphodiesterase (5'-nucleotidase family)